MKFCDQIPDLEPRCHRTRVAAIILKYCIKCLWFTTYLHVLMSNQIDIVAGNSNVIKQNSVLVQSTELSSKTIRHTGPQKYAGKLELGGANL